MSALALFARRYALATAVRLHKGPPGGLFLFPKVPDRFRLSNSRPFQGHFLLTAKDQPYGL